MRRKRQLPRRTRDEAMVDFPALRQSLLGQFDSCHLSALFDLEGYHFDNHAQARGHIFHAFAGEVLRTLRRTGETMMPIEEGLQILYEVCAQRDVPSEEVVCLPLKEQRLVRIAAIKFLHDQEFNMVRLIDVERRLYTDIEYPDPDGGMVKRTITGQLDALVADPPTEENGWTSGAIVPDWKMWMQPPPRYEGEKTDSPERVSYQGYFQQRFYGLLVFRNFPAVERVKLREYYPLAGEAREATVYREQEEHLEREIAIIVEQIDRAIMEGGRSPIWRPSPGRHCSYCAKPNRCPIEADVRAFAGGGIARPSDAERFGAEAVVAGEVRKKLIVALKAWAEQYGPIPVKSAKGRYEWGWQKNKTGGGKRFGVHVPERSDRGPRDEQLRAAFKEAEKR